MGISDGISNNMGHRTLSARQMGRLTSGDFGGPMKNVTAGWTGRPNLDFDSNDELRDDISQHGIKTPITLASSGWSGQDDNKTMEVANGHHRYVQGVAAGVNKFPTAFKSEYSGRLANFLGGYTPPPEAQSNGS